MNFIFSYDNRLVKGIDLVEIEMAIDVAVFEIKIDIYGIQTF